MTQRLKDNFVNFKIEGRVGVIIVISIITSLLSIGGLITTVQSHKTRIANLEANCKVISVSIGRIDENTKNTKETIGEIKTDLKEHIRK